MFSVVALPCGSKEIDTLPRKDDGLFGDKEGKHLLMTALLCEVHHILFFNKLSVGNR
jgi:hypothetical protein